MMTMLMSDFTSDYTDGGSGASCAREQTKRARIRQHDSAQSCGRVPLPTHWFSACTPGWYQQAGNKECQCRLRSGRSVPALYRYLI
jgi:hypothetical protein